MDAIIYFLRLVFLKSLQSHCRDFDRNYIQEYDILSTSAKQEMSQRNIISTGRVVHHLIFCTEPFLGWKFRTVICVEPLGRDVAQYVPLYYHVINSIIVYLKRLQESATLLSLFITKAKRKKNGIS